MFCLFEGVKKGGQIDFEKSIFQKTFSPPGRATPQFLKLSILI